jgi:hypothetical protein
MGNFFPELRNLTRKETIFGIPTSKKNKEANATNFMIFTTSSYIYRCASIGCKPNIEKNLLEIERTAKREVGATNQNGTLSWHASKAEIVIDRLTASLGSRVDPNITKSR